MNTTAWRYPSLKSVGWLLCVALVTACGTQRVDDQPAQAAPVLVLNDRVLISHTYSYHDETGNRADIGYNSKMKIMPLSWFYGGMDPDTPNPTLVKLAQAPKP